MGAFENCKSKEELYAIPKPAKEDPAEEEGWREMDPEPRVGISAEALKQVQDQMEAAGSSSLPNRGEYEQLLGRSLPDVQVYQGISKLSVLGTDAAASHNEIAFAGPIPQNKRIVMHELMHVLQFGGSRGGGGEMSQPGESAEVEAEKMARYAALGLSDHVEASSRPSAPLARNPNPSPPPASPIQSRGGDHSSGGAQWRFKDDSGNWGVERTRTFEEDDLRESPDSNLKREVTVEIAGRTWEVKTPDDWALIADEIGDQEADNVAATYEVGGVHANALAQYAVTTEKIEAKLGAAANITLAAGSLIIQTDWLSMQVLNETIRGRAGVKLEAAAVAEVSGEVGLEIGAGDDGPEAGLSSEAKAFAGARAGIKGFLKMDWTPPSNGPEDIAGASVGVEGWAGAALAAKLEISLIPELKASGYYAAALGWGAGAKAEIKIHVINSALLSLVLAGRGAARALNGIGLDAIGGAIDKMLDGLWIDDAARAVANDETALGAVDINRATELINHMLDGNTLNEDEQAILLVLARAEELGGLRTVVYGVNGGVYTLLDKFNGEEYDQLLEYLYVTQDSVDDLPIDDDLARTLVELGHHRTMPRNRLNNHLIRELLDGYTGGEDERALMTICRDRLEAISDGTIQDILDNVHGTNDDALRGFLWMKDRLENVDVDDDCARAVINADFHQSVNNVDKLNVLLDALIDGATGNDDERAIIKLLTDCNDYARRLDAGRLEEVLDNVDGEEYEELLVVLRRANKIDFLQDGIDFDDDIARIAIRNDLHEGVMRNAELTRAIQELNDGITGDEDERAIIDILQSNLSSVRQILSSERLAEQTKSNVDGAEYDELMAIFVTADFMSTNIDIDDDLARAMVRLGLHTHANNRSRLREFVDALLDGVTGDADEQAIIALINDCPSLRDQIDDDFMARIANDVDGAEYTDLVVTLRRHGKIDVGHPPIRIDDDDSRALVDEISVATFSDAELDRLVENMLDGFTGDADEERILQICRGTNYLASVEDARFDAIVDNVHGVEHTELWTLVWMKARSRYDPTHEGFDDDAARAGVSIGVHQSLTTVQNAAMIDKMIDGFTGNEDEQHILTIVRHDDGAVFDAMDDNAINVLHDNFHGDEQEELFVWCGKNQRIDYANLHQDFDDNTARKFVEEGLHTSHQADSLRREVLIDKMLEGFTGDADEEKILSILDADAELIRSRFSPGKLKTLLRAFDGAENTALWIRIARAEKVDLSWPDYIALGFDDDVARAIIGENLHRTFSGEDLAKCIDELCKGWAGDEDGEATLKILRDYWDRIESHLTEVRIHRIAYNFQEGDKRDRLLALLWIHAKLPTPFPQPPAVSKACARGLIAEGHHNSSDVTDDLLMRLYRALIDGGTGDEEERALLTLFEAKPHLIAREDITTEELVSNFDGHEEAQLLVLMVDQGHIDLTDELIDDAAIREFVAQDKHLDPDVEATTLHTLIERIVEGSVGPEDATAIYEILSQRDAGQIPTLLGDVTLQELDRALPTEDGHKIAGFLYENSTDHRRAVIDGMTADRAEYFVDHDLTDEMAIADAAVVLDTLIGQRRADHAAVLIRDRADEIPALVTDVRAVATRLLGDAKAECVALIFQNGNDEQKAEALDNLDAIIAERFVRQELYTEMDGEQARKLIDGSLRSGSANGNRDAVVVVQWASEQGANMLAEIVGTDQERFLSQFNATYRPDVEALIGGGEEESDDAAPSWPGVG